MKTTIMVALLLVLVAVGAIVVHRMGEDQPDTPAPARNRGAQGVPLNLDKFLTENPGLGGSQSGKSPSPPNPQKPKEPAGNAPVGSGTKSPASPLSQPAPRPADQKALQALVAEAEQLMAKGQSWEARKKLSEAFLKADPNTAEAIKIKLDQMTDELILSPTPVPDSVVHVARSGETLIKIAKQYHTTHGLLKRINLKRSDRLRIDERLKVLKGEPSIVVDKAHLKLTLLLDGVYVRQYPICVGKHDQTPEGEFTIAVKQIKPTWYPPGGGAIPYGHPKHQLGTRWLGFASKPGYSGYGIHGTNQPDTVPGRLSLGCVRMLNKDAEEIYDFVILGTKVHVKK